MSPVRKQRIVSEACFRDLPVTIDVNATNRGATHGPTLVITPAKNSSGGAYALPTLTAASPSRNGSTTLISRRRSSRHTGHVIVLNRRVRPGRLNRLECCRIVYAGAPNIVAPNAGSALLCGYLIAAGSRW